MICNITEITPRQEFTSNFEACNKLHNKQEFIIEVHELLLKGSLKKLVFEFA